VEARSYAEGRTGCLERALASAAAPEERAPARRAPGGIGVPRPGEGSGPPSLATRSGEGRRITPTMYGPGRAPRQTGPYIDAVMRRPTFTGAWRHRGGGTGQGERPGCA